MSRDLARHLAGLAGGMRTAHPDLEAHQLVETVNGLGMVTRPDWPEGQVIGVPFAGHATDSGIGACDVGFQFGSRQHPFIFGGMTRTFGDIKKAAVVITALGQWHQSNYSSGQNAVGGSVDPGLYPMDPATVSTWPLPTSDDPLITHAGLKPYGLVQYTDGTTEIYASMWPRKRESDGKIQVCAGAWNAASKAAIWENLEGAFYIPEEMFENQVSPFYNLFHTSVGHWLFMVATTAYSGGYQYNRIYSTNASLPYLPTATLGFDGETHNASIHAWEEGIVEGIPVNKFYCFLPYFYSTPNPDAVVNFLTLNEATGYWSRGGTRTIATLPVGGEALVPDLIGTGNGEALGPPAAWLDKEALIFVSGGTLDILDATKWEKIHWTIRSLKPADGTDGAFVKSKSVTATDSPPLLDPGSMKAAATAHSWPLYYSGTYVDGMWISGPSFSDDTQAAYKHFKRVCPIILPVKEPNLGRLTTIESRMANDHLENAQWPPIFANCGGGPVVDEAGTVWSIILEPVQCLYGGEYTFEDTGTTRDVTLWTIMVHFHQGDLEFLGWGEYGPPSPLPTFADLSIPELPDSDSSVSTVISDSEPTLPPDTVEGDWVGPRFVYDIYGVLAYAYYFRHLDTRTYSTTSTSTPKPIWTHKWNQYHGCKLHTMLRGHRTNGTTVEKDISQKIDATTIATFGYPGPNPGINVSQTQIDMELGDNVHQLISFADKSLLAILRDLHADGAGNNPSPAIEIWQIGSTSATKLSTIRLGSYTETLAMDAMLGTYDTKAGDQEWDPYAYGPPRMKACRKSGGGNVPVIVAMVGECKKVDPTTDSQFKRVCYATIELNSPASPDVVRSARTSEDLGVGSSGEPTGTDFHAPIWDSWDTLVLTPAGVAWIVDSEFRETTA